MPNQTPICTHMKTDGVRCGSPAVKGTDLCFHHSAVKTALGKVTPLDKVEYGAFTPIPFVFPEDRASMQINYFLLLQALNEQRVEKRAAEVMLRLLKAMDKNLGKSGSLVDSGEAASEEMVNPTLRCAKDGAPGDEVPSDEAGSVPPTSLRDAGHPGKEIALEDALSRVIDEVNASAARPHRGYADYREVSALHPAGQRGLNMYFERPMDR